MSEIGIHLSAIKAQVADNTKKIANLYEILLPNNG